MDRRSLIKLGLLGISGVAAPTLVTAKGAAAAPVAGGLYYTKENPGRWSKKAAGHFPIVEKLKDGKIKVMTSHAMNGYEHYIVKHILLDKDYNFISEHMFDPTRDKVALSTFDVGSYTGKLHALSVCNKHDTWLNSVSV
jgi:superoxide reductase